jgi:uncharacterized membrane protein YgcG
MSAGRFAARSSARATALALETDLITRLRSLPVGPRPDPRFKSDLRSQLVSITARVVAESATDASAVSGRGAQLTAKSSRAGVGVLRAVRQPLLAFAAAAAVLVMLLGAAVWISSGSLPGDSLYGVKRASENVQLSLATSDADKGRTYLEFARNRVNEAIRLLGRPSAGASSGVIAAGRVSDHTAKLVIETLASADSDSRSGVQLLGRSAVTNLSADPLAKLDSWLPDQRAKLSQVLDRSPAGALHDRTQGSVNLLQRVAARSDALKKNLGCPCLAAAVSDDLGPLPCSPCQPLTSSVPGSSRAPGQTSVPGGPPRLPGIGGTPTATPSGSAGQQQGSNSGGSQSGPAPSSGPALPGAPSQGVPSLPVSGGSSGLSGSVPGVSVSGSAGSGGISVSLPLPPITTPGLLKLN